MFCPTCGTDAGNASFCSSCGTRLGRQQNPGPSHPAGGPSRSGAAVVIAGVLAGVMVVAILGIGGFFLVGRNKATPAADAASPASVPATPATTPAPATARPAKKPTPKPTATGARDVRTQPIGLFCRDLMSRGYSYVAAIDYWRMHGQPNQMDADRNGIPCETVYSPSDVSSYWSTRDLPQVASSSIDFLPSGLLCRDLYARNVSYADAVAYWWEEGAPDRMDAEFNGIPCETVYPAFDIANYW